jgi:hypothetical protein
MDPEDGQALEPGDPLAALGLLDPRTGEALATEDWQPSADGAGSSQSSRWDTPDNPYKVEAEQLRGQVPTPMDGMAQARVFHAQANAEIERVTPMVEQQLLMTGQYTPEQARVITEAYKREALGRVETHAMKLALLDTAKEKFAREVAKDFTFGNVTVNPDELVGEPSMEDMRQKARRLWTERRDGKFTARRAAGTDAVEGTAPSGVKLSQALEKLSPFDTIRYGLARGDLGTR